MKIDLDNAILGALDKLRPLQWIRLGNLRKKTIIQEENPHEQRFLRHIDRLVNDTLIERKKEPKKTYIRLREQDDIINEPSQLFSAITSEYYGNVPVNKSTKSQDGWCYEVTLKNISEQSFWGVTGIVTYTGKKDKVRIRINVEQVLRPDGIIQNKIGPFKEKIDILTVGVGFRDSSSSYSISQEVIPSQFDYELVSWKEEEIP